MAILVRVTSEGFEVAEDDRALSTHATMREALDAARPLVGSKAKAAFLRDPDTKTENGAWRWLPATEEEAEAIDGVRIDATAIEEMAASLNARATPIPVDGGPTPSGHLASEVHGTATSKGATPANGWAHDAVIAIGDDGLRELYLWAELVPEVARETDSGRVALGSVHFAFGRLDGEAPRECVLVSHALTNDPAVTSLAPASSVRVGDRDLRSARRACALVNRRLSAPAARRDRTMSKAKTLRARFVEQGFRGPAIDKLAEVAALLGIGIDDELSAERWDSPVVKAIDAVRGLASAEKILEGITLVPAGQVAAGRGLRAGEEGGESTKAMGDLAKIAAALGLGADADEAAILAEIEKRPKEAAAAADAGDAAARARADLTMQGLRDQNAALAERVKKLEPLLEKSEQREREDAIRAALASKGIRDATRAKVYLDHGAKFGGESALSAIEAIATPPGGERLFAPSSPSGSRAPETASVGVVRSAERKKAIDAELVEVRKERPTLALHDALSAARKRAQKRSPELFTSETAAD